ncbi:hypothetical protein AB1Y20_019726 [Prymnesium parvum]|uniref:Uncharacterized protein n=1 Tax=Prymnesium parvum TaxID=97485 RepID=A0AB34JV66_PRYPA
MRQAEAGAEALQDAAHHQRTIGRLEAALDELDEAKAISDAEALELRQELEQKRKMLEFVEREVHSVKALFTEKERAMAEEMEQKLAAKDEELRTARAAEQKASAHASQERTRAESAEARCEQEAAAAREARQEVQSLRNEIAARVSELQSARERKAHVEEEMRLVLRAMEHQKQVAARNLNQLNHVFGIGSPSGADVHLGHSAA